MPGHDGTGPLGQGPGTGWGLGPCGAGMAFGRRGLGRGSGRGLRRMWRFRTANIGLQPIELTEKDEKKILEEEIKEIEAEKQDIEKRLKEIKTTK